MKATRAKALVPADWNIAAGQSIGRREEQQDAHGRCAIRLDDGEVVPVVVVVDGMGGEVGGRLAAETAVRAFLTACEDGVAFDVALRLRDALLAANAAVAGRATEDPSLAGMGCTLVALALGRGRATWISVGDSLLLRRSRTGMERLNADHSMAPALDAAARAGELSAEEAASHPQRSVLLSALTGRAISLIDERSVPLNRDDHFLLASDGLLSLAEAEVAAAVAQGAAADADDLVASLLAAVEAKGQADQDNCTIIAVLGSQSAPPRRSRVKGVSFLVLGIVVLGLIAALFWKKHGLWLGATDRPQAGGTAPRASVSGKSDLPVGPRRSAVSAAIWHGR